MSARKQAFRAYDIRGIVGEVIDEQFAFDLGRALGLRLGAGARAAVGRDCRTHGLGLQQALLDGLMAEGVETVALGMVPTPLVYYAVYRELYRLDAGVVVTASHNPKEYNGFKITLGTQSFYGDALQELARQMLSLESKPRVIRVHETLSVQDDYLHEVAVDVCLERKLKVVVDGGNGSGGLVACALFERLGAEVIPLYCEPDGTFPNHHPDPTVAANVVDLQAAVVEHQADLGIGLDGDSDRLGVVDETGELIAGDRLLLMLAREVLKSNPGARIIGEVKCSADLFDGITRAGGEAIMSAVGHSILKERLVQEKALLAGEMSGHIYFADRFYGFDDALYAGARLLEVIASERKSLGDWLSDVPKRPASPEIRIECSDTTKFDVVRRCAEHFRSKGHSIIDIDGARVLFERGWALVRASNTQPSLVLRVEAEAEDALQELLAELLEVVESVVGEMSP